MDSHLYDRETGEFLFRGKKLGLCVLCGAKGWVFDVGALAPSTRFCKGCIKKETPKQLRRDSNIALARAKRAHDHFNAELRDMGERYRQRFGANIAWDLPQVIASKKV